VGFNEQRGDLVEVQSVRFERPVVEPPPPSAGVQFQTSDIMRFAEVGAALIAALAFVVFVMRPLITGLVRGGGAPALARAGAAAGGDLAALGGPVAAGLPGADGAGLAPSETATVSVSSIQGRVNASSAKQIAEVVQNHPDESAQIIRTWLNNAS
jgi:flagellar M-ring protein FliF